MPEVLIDLLLAAILIGLSLRIITDADLYRAVVLFIVFGLLLSLAWVRLNAPDIALAEAAIGAGLTGALLLGAVGQMRRRGQPSEESGPGRDGDGR
jgi:energy-converting hydrogenase B subunit D